MWTYERRLEFPVNIKEPNAKLAQVIISQFGGPDGELSASMRYLSQRYSMPYREVAGLLTDIGTEASEMLRCTSMAFSEAIVFITVHRTDSLASRNRIAPFHRKKIQIYINIISVVDNHFIKYLCVKLIFIFDAADKFVNGCFNVLRQFLLFVYHSLLFINAFRHSF